MAKSIFRGEVALKDVPNNQGEVLPSVSYTIPFIKGLKVINKSPIVFNLKKIRVTLDVGTITTAGYEGVSLFCPMSGQTDSGVYPQIAFFADNDNNPFDWFEFNGYDLNLADARTAPPDEFTYGDKTYYIFTKMISGTNVSPSVVSSDMVYSFASNDGMNLIIDATDTPSSLTFPGSGFALAVEKELVVPQYKVHLDYVLSTPVTLQAEGGSFTSDIMFSTNSAVLDAYYVTERGKTSKLTLNNITGAELVSITHDTYDYQTLLEAAESRVLNVLDIDHDAAFKIPSGIESDVITYQKITISELWFLVKTLTDRLHAVECAVRNVTHDQLEDAAAGSEGARLREIKDHWQYIDPENPE